MLAACGSKSNAPASGSTASDSAPATVIYQSENGEIEIPANPKRIAMLTNTYAGNLLALGITPIAVNEYPKENKFYEGKLDEVEVITAEGLRDRNGTRFKIAGKTIGSKISWTSYSI